MSDRRPATPARRHRQRVAAAAGLPVAVALTACAGGGDAAAPATSLAIPGGAASAGPSPGVATAPGGTDASGSGSAPGATVGGATVDVTDPVAVAVAFTDDYLSMLADPADPSLRTSAVAGSAGLGFLADEAGRVAEEGLDIDGTWTLTVDGTDEVDGLAVVTGCLDVTGLTATRDGEPAPFPGDGVPLSVELSARGESWQSDRLTITDDTCTP